MHAIVSVAQFYILILTSLNKPGGVYNVQDMFYCFLTTRVFAAYILHCSEGIFKRGI